MLQLLILILLAFSLSQGMTGLVRHYAIRNAAILDIPNERSSHTQPTPRGGGLGFIIAFAVTTVISFALSGYFGNPSESQLTNPAFLWLILTPLVIIGIIDDQRGVPASLRYLIQLIAAGVTVAYFGTFPQPWLTGLGTVGTIIAIAFTIIGMTAFINFYNFMDGLDGLVAGVTAVQLSFLGYYLNQPLFWLLAAALLGFLWWNWSPAKIFMGDAGSTVLGASVAIALLNSNTDPIQAWSALTITLPLIGDAIYTLIRRLIRRENIFKAHRTHLYQRLQQAGWSHAQVAIAYIIATSLIILAITTLGTTGIGLSLVGVVLAIAIGELYLRSHLAVAKTFVKVIQDWGIRSLSEPK